MSTLSGHLALRKQTALPEDRDGRTEDTVYRRQRRPFIDAIPDEAVRQDRIQLDVLKVMAAASLRYLRETEAST